MRILDLARKDIAQILRDWKSALFMLIMPVLFTVFFGLILGPVLTGDRQADPRLPVGWLNEDPQGLLSPNLEMLLANSDVIRPVALEGVETSQASNRVAEGELAAVIRIPAGYSQAVISDQAASLEVIADQTTTAGRVAVNALDTITGRLLGAVESAHISAEIYQQQVGFKNEPNRQVFIETAFQQAVSAWGEPALKVSVDLATGVAVGQDVKISGFTQSSAGMIVQFAIMGLINSAMILVMERKTRCLQRLLTTPIRGAEVIAGHILAMFLVVFTQQLILILLGQFVFGVDYLRQPAAVLLMMVAMAVWAATLGLLIGAIARKEDQVIVLCLVTMFIFSALGGAWFPLDVAGKAFSTIGHLLPTAWAMEGYQNIILRGLGFESVLLPAGLLLAYALAFFGLALARFKFE